jgi:hypothetical protein
MCRLAPSKVGGVNAAPFKGKEIASSAKPTISSERLDVLT